MSCHVLLVVLLSSIIVNVSAQACDGEVSETCGPCATTTENFLTCYWCSTDKRCWGFYDIVSCTGAWLSTQAECDEYTPAPTPPPPPPGSPPAPPTTVPVYDCLYGAHCDPLPTGWLEKKGYCCPCTSGTISHMDLGGKVTCTCTCSTLGYTPYPTMAPPPSPPPPTPPQTSPPTESSASSGFNEETCCEGVMVGVSGVQAGQVCDAEFKDSAFTDYYCADGTVVDTLYGGGKYCAKCDSQLSDLGIALIVFVVLICLCVIACVVCCVVKSRRTPPAAQSPVTIVQNVPATGSRPVRRSNRGSVQISATGNRGSVQYMRRESGHLHRSASGLQNYSGGGGERRSRQNTAEPSYGGYAGATYGGYAGATYDGNRAARTVRRSGGY